MCQHVCARRVHPDKEWLIGLFGLIHERDGVLGDHLVEGPHIVFDTRDRFWRQRTFIDNFLLADFTPAGLLRWIIDISCKAVNQIARTNGCFPLRWISAVEWVFHRVQMIEVSEKFIET